MGRERERIRTQILQELTKGEKSIYEILYIQDASLPEIFELIKEMEKEGSVNIKEGKLSLTRKGKEEASKKRAHYLGEIGCKSCEETGYIVEGFFEEVLEEYKEVCADRPEAVGEYDQGFISEEGVIKRLEFIYERGDLADTNIFVVGDDDLFSVSAALTGLPKRVVVIDIDERIIGFINKVAKEKNLRLEAFTYDVQKKLPERFRRKFDVFVTDPVETLPGLKLFLSRGASALNGKGCSAYFGITTLEASREKWFEIEKMLIEMGFVITDIRRHFSIYPVDEKNFFRFQDRLPIVKKLEAPVDFNWYNSAFFRIEAIAGPKPLIEGEMIIDEKVYRDEESWATPI